TADSGQDSARGRELRGRGRRRAIQGRGVSKRPPHRVTRCKPRSDRTIADCRGNSKTRIAAAIASRKFWTFDARRGANRTLNRPRASVGESEGRSPSEQSNPLWVAEVLFVPFEELRPGIGVTLAAQVLQRVRGRHAA